MAAAAVGSATAPLTYLIAYRTSGLAFAVAAAAATSVVAQGVERRLTGRSLWSILGLLGLAASGALALITNDAALFYVRSVLVRAAWGAVFVASAAIGRPAVGALFGWMLPPARRPLLNHHRAAFGTVTLWWGTVELLKATLRGYVLATGSLEAFTAVLILSGWPVEALLLVWSIRYLHRQGVALTPTEGTPND